MSVRMRDDVRRAVIRAAAEEAGRRGSGRIGTQDLLLASLVDPTSDAVRILAVDLREAREAVDRLDRAALSAVGVDLGDLALAPRRPAAGRRPPLAAGARAAIGRAVRTARVERARRVEMRHLVLGLLGCPPGDHAFEVLEALRVDRDSARRRASG
jgi:ATP-dependent Clp protease ATP-binding subunit ClpA